MSLKSQGRTICFICRRESSLLRDEAVELDENNSFMVVLWTTLPCHCQRNGRCLQRIKNRRMRSSFLASGLSLKELLDEIVLLKRHRSTNFKRFVATSLCNVDDEEVKDEVILEIYRILNKAKILAREKKKNQY